MQFVMGMRLYRASRGIASSFAIIKHYGGAHVTELDG